MAPDASKFSVKDRVLCYHGPMIYEATILKTEVYDESNAHSGEVGFHAFVHYKGWKNTWDEWVKESRLLQYNDVNLKLQKETNTLSLAAENAKKVGTGHAHTAKSSSTSNRDSSSAKGGAGGAAGSSSGRRDGARHVGGTAALGKRKREEGDDAIRRPELKLVIPDLFKVVLVDDWEYITRNHMLVPLPRSPSVQEVLKQFEQHIINMPNPLPQSQSIIHTLISGLQTYFDRALGSVLLYRFERAQYASMRKKYITGQHVEPGANRTMSSIYGAEHLARLVVKMPEMVGCTSMDDASVGLLGVYLGELMNWMCAHKTELFLAEYEHPPPAYTNIARA